MELKTVKYHVPVIRDIGDARTFFRDSNKERTIYLQLESVLRRNNIDLMFSKIKPGIEKAKATNQPQVVVDFLMAAQERLLALGFCARKVVLNGVWFIVASNYVDPPLPCVSGVFYAFYHLYFLYE